MATSWPTHEAARYATTRAARQRRRPFPSKDPADYAAGEKSFAKWFAQVGPSKDPADYRAREKTMAWVVTGPVRPPIWFYVLYVLAVGTSVARAYVTEGSDASLYLLYVTSSLFAISAVVLIATHRHRWRQQQAT